MSWQVLARLLHFLSHSSRHGNLSPERLEDILQSAENAIARRIGRPLRPFRNEARIRVRIGKRIRRIETVSLNWASKNSGGQMLFKEIIAQIMEDAKRDAL